jgi:hypothetical protein
MQGMRVAEPGAFPALPSAASAPAAAGPSGGGAAGAGPSGGGGGGKKGGKKGGGGGGNAQKQSLGEFFTAPRVHPQNPWRNPALRDAALPPGSRARGDWARGGGGALAAEERALLDAYGTAAAAKGKRR